MPHQQQHSQHTDMLFHPAPTYYASNGTPDLINGYVAGADPTATAFHFYQPNLAAPWSDAPHFDV
jgi:hypothetical protein